MICQRCGHCCVTMGVVIPVPVRGSVRAVWKPYNVVCPHLSFEGAATSCGVHGHPCYEGSPCHIYGNSDIDPDYYHKRGVPCPVGQSILAYSIDVTRAAAACGVDDLEDLGEWEEVCGE